WNRVARFGTRVFLRERHEPVRPRCPASRHIGVSGLTATSLLTSVQTTAQRVERTLQFRVAWSQTYGAFELTQRVPPPALFYMDPRKIHVRKLTRLVALGQFRSLEPGNGLLELALLHQVTPYVVVGVSEVGIHFDGLQA